MMQESASINRTPLLGIDIGGTKCAVVIGDVEGSVLSRVEAPTSSGLDTWPSAGTELVQLIVRAWHAAGNSDLPIKNIGVSCGGPLDSRSGRILSPPNLPGWRDVDLGAFLSSHFPDSVITVENDANATALAELKWGAGIGYSDFAYLTCGTGIGAGLILNGKLYRGKRDLAGEIGHAVIIPNGPLCQCGKRGCLEALASGSSIGRIGADVFEEPGMTGKLVIERASAGDERANQVLMDAAFYLGIGVANLLQTLDLQRVILGSLAVYAGERYLNAVVAAAAENMWAEVADGVMIVPSGLGSKTQDLAALAVAGSLNDRLCKISV